MAAKHNLSLEEILAACRAQDGAGGSSAAAPPAKPAVPTPAEAPAKAKASAKPEAASAKSNPGQMSVAEMLAAARSADSGGGAAKPAAGDKPAPAAQPAAGSKPGGMSVAEMLAAARAEKSAPAKAAPKATEKKVAAEKKPAADVAAKPPAEKSALKGKAAGPKDTASILAAARGGAKPGPITKAEAAARVKESEAPAKKKLDVPPMPAKPEYARLPAPAPATTERRGFLVAVTAVFAGALFLTSSLAVGFSSLAVTSLLWLLGTARFMFPNILTEQPTRFKVGFPDDFAPGQVQTKFIAQFGVWVVRYEYDGQPMIFALQSVCTHLGCTPNWLEGEQKFKCPCHGSGFYKDGINFEGPAPRPLERFAIRLADDGQLEVDKSRRFKEEIGQWRDPASFVPV